MKPWIAILAAVTLSTLGCGPKTDSVSTPRSVVRNAPDPSKSSILLVTLDTVRGDFLGSAGDPVTRTPHLDRISRQGIQYEHGYASCPLTLPSHTTMLTGLEPPQHGVLDNGTYRLPENIPTLAAALREMGFRTGAFISGFTLMSQFGLDRGFEVYNDEMGDGANPFAGAHRPGDQIAKLTAEWIRSLPQDARWFAWAHFFDAHEPYDPPKAYIRASGGDAYRGDLAFLDEHVGALLTEDLLDATPWILLVGDHGESVGNHGESTHGVFVYDATLKIPAILWPAPQGQSLGVARSFLRTMDVPSTAFELLGLEKERAPGNGVSALSQMPPSAYFESRYTYLHFGWAPLHGMRDPKWKLIDAPETELYDLEADPAEKVNVAAKHPDVVAKLRTEWKQFASSKIDAPRVELDAQSKEALESLGYTTSHQEAAPPTGGADPKRMIILLPMFTDAYNLLSAGQWENALVVLRAAVAKDPKNKEVYKLMGMAHARMGRHREALDAHQQSLSLPPHDNDRMIRIEMVGSYMQLGREDDAIVQLEKVLAEDPNDPATWVNLGALHEKRGDLAAARRAWENALKADSTYALAREALSKMSPQ
jgi:tetratricopeptide (TPR) repeat protein